MSLNASVGHGGENKGAKWAVKRQTFIDDGVDDGVCLTTLWAVQRECDKLGLTAVSELDCFRYNSECLLARLVNVSTFEAENPRRRTQGGASSDICRIVLQAHRSTANTLSGMVCPVTIIRAHGHPRRTPFPEMMDCGGATVISFTFVLILWAH
ncbi:hypothetical protein NDA17_000231 [Ustilago hordei]|nr:hypothetical protein NDA17_000231 [Ustilago hordei]